MSTTRRTSLGRTGLNFNLNPPPSPQRIVIEQEENPLQNLADLIRHQQTPRSKANNFNSPIIPSLDDEDYGDGSSLPNLIRGRSLDEELVKSGYTPISKMIVINPSGQSSVRYIKAQNKLGEPLYIAVDVDDSYISQSNNDTQLRESRIPMRIRQEEKETAFNKAGMGVSGVALECKNGLCTILHDEQMNAPHEQNFVLVHTKKFEESLVLASFPVVKMSEIRANPHIVNKNIDQALRKMRNGALSECLCNIKTVQAKFDQTCHLFKETLHAKEKVIAEFKRTMDILENAYDGCCKCPEKNHEKLKEIVFNIEKRNAKFPLLMQSCQEIASLECVLDEAITTLNQAKCKLEKKFKHLHCAYELKNKKHHNHHKCAWEDHGEDDPDTSDEE